MMDGIELARWAFHQWNQRQTNTGESKNALPSGIGISLANTALYCVGVGVRCQGGSGRLPSLPGASFGQSLPIDPSGPIPL